MLFHFKKKSSLPESFDRTTLRPVILVSICTGEEVAGFRSLISGKFSEDRLIRSPQDLQEFMDHYGLTEPPPREY